VSLSVAAGEVWMVRRQGLDPDGARGSDSDIIPLRSQWWMIGLGDNAIGGNERTKDMKKLIEQRPRIEKGR